MAAKNVQTYSRNETGNISSKSCSLTRPMAYFLSTAWLILSEPSPSHSIRQFSGAKVSGDNSSICTSRTALNLCGPTNTEEAFRARPKTSKPGPRFAELHGTLIVFGIEMIDRKGYQGCNGISCLLS